MAIYIDPPRWPAHGIRWSHLISDESYEELHAFATRMAIPRRSFDLDHYDVAEVNYDLAVKLGARAVSSNDLVRVLIRSGLRFRQVDRERVTPQRRHEYLWEQWNMLGANLGYGTVEGWELTGEELLERWNEPHRSYHDARHLEDVLLALDHLRTAGEEISLVTQLAAWFHDAVYLGQPVQDERASAELAVYYLHDLQVPSRLADMVHDFIIATIPGQTPPRVSLPLAHLLDADLAIFAAGEKRYREYARAVRDEYASVPEDEFRKGRARILQGYLDRPEIYQLSASQSLWERRARRNLQQEVAHLQS